MRETFQMKLVPDDKQLKPFVAAQKMRRTDISFDKIQMLLWHLSNFILRLYQVYIHFCFSRL